MEYNELPENFYWLLDGRAGAIAIQNDTADISQHDWTRYIITGGSAKECCEDANEGDYGGDCVVSNQQGVIMFEWFKNDNWDCNNSLTPNI